tara:strand:- start:1235 stop:2011 length:777 start_codon:yes stop_codon:yes gene_type:complete
MVDKIPDSVTALGFRVLLGVADVHDHSIMLARSVSNEQLMERTGLNRRGLARGRQQLIEAGLIEASQQDENRNSSRWNYRFRPEILVPIGDGLQVRPDRPSVEESPKQVDQVVQQVDKTVPLSDKVVSLQQALNSGKSVATTLVSEPKNEDDSEDIRIRDNKSLLESVASKTKSSHHDLTEPAGAGSVVVNKSVELADKMIALARSRLEVGEVDLNDWKSLALEAISPNVEGAKLLFVSYPEQEIKDEWFKRAVRELR